MNNGQLKKFLESLPDDAPVRVIQGIGDEPLRILEYDAADDGGFSLWVDEPPLEAAVSMRLDTEIRRTWTEGAQKRIDSTVRSLRRAEGEDLLLLAASVLLDHIARGPNDRYLMPEEEGVRLAINRRLAGAEESDG